MLDKFDRLDQRVVHPGAREKGDQIDQQIRDKLEGAFVTPFDREDIYELAVRLDDVVDFIQAVAETIVIYDVASPTVRRPTAGADPRRAGCRARTGHNQSRVKERRCRAPAARP